MMAMTTRRTLQGAVLFGVLLAASATSAQSVAVSATAAAQEQRARAYFTNLELVTQDGETVRFFEDVLKGRVVLINFVFTECKNACPLATRKLTQVIDLLDGRFGAPIHFVSMSLDPETDTPAVLEAFARKHGADHAGWTFLTGNPAHLDLIIKKLGQYTENIQAHSSLMLAGNVPTARWTKIAPHAAPQGIAEKLLALARDDATP